MKSATQSLAAIRQLVKEIPDAAHESDRLRVAILIIGHIIDAEQAAMQFEPNHFPLQSIPPTT